MDADRVRYPSFASSSSLRRAGAVGGWLLSVGGCSLDDRELQPRDPTSCGMGGGSSLCQSGGKSGKGGASSSGDGGKSASAGGDTSQPEAGAPVTAGSGGDPEPNCPDLDNNDVADCDETLAQNPTFDDDAEEWAPEGEASVVWDSYDGTAQLSSGSILIENKAPASTLDGQVTKTAAQCIPLTGGQSYVVLAQMYIQANMVRGYGLLSGYFYDGEDCTGTVLLTGISPQNGTIQSWRTLGVTLSAPVPARSLLLGLGVSRRADDPLPFSARFDNVLVKKSGQ